MITIENLIDDYLDKFDLKTKHHTHIIPKESKYYGLIVETRKLRKFKERIHNHLYFLNQSNSKIKWGLQIFHGVDNEDYIRDETKQIKNIIYEKIEIKNFDKKEYSNYLKSLNFWNKVKGDKILIFQTDSLLLRYGIDKFIDYDYVGAPWTKPKEGSFIGNGGLSLRTVSVMKTICKKEKSSEDIWEDIFFSSHMKNFNIPELEMAMRFSVEDVFYPTPLGLHNPIKLTVDQVQLILNKSLEII